jgi:hypothetical protein
LICAGAAAGAGLGFKYAAAPLIAPCMVGALGTLLGTRPRWPTAALFIPLTLVSALGTFLLLSPESAKNPHAFWESLVLHGARFSTTDPTLPPGWKFHLLQNLPTACGWLGLAGGLVGLWLIWRRDRWACAILGAQLVGYFLFLAPIRMLFVRYLSPLLPSLAVGVAVCLSWSVEVARRKLDWRRFGLPMGLGALLLLPTAARLIQFDRLMSRADTRDLATAWLRDNAGDAPVLLEGGRYVSLHAVTADRVQFCRPAVPDALYRAPAILSQGVPRYLVQPSIDCMPFFLGPVAPVSRCFQPVATFSAGKVPSCEAYDQFDAFWLPYFDFTGVSRPGPNLTIYRNLCAGR